MIARYVRVAIFFIDYANNVSVILRFSVKFCFTCLDPRCLFVSSFMISDDRDSFSVLIVL